MDIRGVITHKNLATFKNWVNNNVHKNLSVLAMNIRALHNQLLEKETLQLLFANNMKYNEYKKMMQLPNDQWTNMSYMVTKYCTKKCLLLDWKVSSGKEPD